MKQEDITYLLKHPESVSVSQTESLGDSIKSYPYFQALHALYLKGLKQKESYKYNNALKTTAAYTTDRSVLFDFITSDSFNQNEISEQIKQNSENLKDIEVNDLNDISVDKSVLIDDALKAHIKATEGVLDPELFETKPTENTGNILEDDQSPDSVSKTILSIDVDRITPEEKLEIGKPLEFDKNESHSFIEWLKITSFKPIEREPKDEDPSSSEMQKAEADAPLKSKMTIIDKFISENPKIKPVSSTSPKPKLVDDGHVSSDSLMTETLARIYLEQKSYEKAIQSYKILSLKYPEKSSFFADQIKAIEELREQNNS